jgi:hypothetical protein
LNTNDFHADIGITRSSAYCKHHHRVKHHAGWTLTMTPDGDCTWTDPHHRKYATHPINHHELAA